MAFPSRLLQHCSERRSSGRRGLLRYLAMASALLLSAVSARAQDWPTKPINLYMGFPAGSGVDVVARMLQPSLEKSLGQRLVIDYKPGAGGNVASELVARSA